MPPVVASLDAHQGSQRDLDVRPGMIAGPLHGGCRDTLPRHDVGRAQGGEAVHLTLGVTVQMGLHQIPVVLIDRHEIGLIVAPDGSESEPEDPLHVRQMRDDLDGRPAPGSGAGAPRGLPQTRSRGADR